MRVLAFLVSIFVFVVPAEAAFVFNIGSVSGVAGTTVIVPVTVQTPDNMQFAPNGGFNLAIDVAPPVGTGLPNGITFNAVTGGPLFANPSLNFGNIGTFGVDGFVNSNASTGVLLVSNVPTLAFNLSFNLGAGVAPGTYAVNFNSNQLTSVTDSRGTALVLGAGYTLNSGSITVTAVPEPTSLALAGSMVVFATGYAGRRRLRRTKSAV